jgi:ribonuclease HII
LDIQSSFNHYERLSYLNYDLVLGIDEAGRGSLAGPVSVCCLSFEKSFFEISLQNDQYSWIHKVKDSKKLLEKEREKLVEPILFHSYFTKTLLISAIVIDKIGINKAIEKAILIFIRHLINFNSYTKIKILIDGNYKFSYKSLSTEIRNIIFDIRMQNYQSEITIKKNNTLYKFNIESIIKGDEKVFTIACASIVAKVMRDRYMKKISTLFPEYEFYQHKGYGTKSHREKINQFGYTFFHRKTYKISKQYKLFS